MLIVLGIFGEWFVHHPRKWIEQQREELSPLITEPLLWIGNPLADITDALDITGEDAVAIGDYNAPAHDICFAGLPLRRANPAPNDIRVLDRGEFLIGWSATLRHPVWCAYRISEEVKFPTGKRPGFTKDKSVPNSPASAEYTRSGYDRGHMVPNYAIVSRFGTVAQKKTFMMTNIAPQTPQLNRGVWQKLERRIADLWTARYGDVWVIVGCISNKRNTINKTIDIPDEFYQMIIAKEGNCIKAMAMLFSQDVSWHEWAARNLISIDELEALTGLDFNPNLPQPLQENLEAQLPSRLWPIRKLDIFELLKLTSS